MTSSNGNIFCVICAGNSPVSGEFPTQRPVTQSFDVFFDLRPNKRLSKQTWGWWFETLSCSLWRHGNGFQCAYEGYPQTSTICLFDVSSAAVNPGVSVDDIVAIVETHNNFRSAVNPTAKDMQKMVSSRMTSWYKNDFALLDLCEGNPPVFFSQRASQVLISFMRASTITIKLPFVWRHCNVVNQSRCHIIFTSKPHWLGKVTLS